MEKIKFSSMYGKFGDNKTMKCTNCKKGLTHLTDCECRKTDSLVKLKAYYEQKKWEYENIDDEHNIGNEGILKGLEIAINIMK